MMLYDIKGKNRWCGPAAIATITGISTDDASRQIRKLNGRTKVTSTDSTEIARCLGVHNYALRLEYYDKKTPVKERLTLNNWLKKKDRDKKATYLVEVTRHWLVVQGNLVSDNVNKGPVLIWQFKGKKKRVSRVWKVTPLYYSKFDTERK